jgi:serine/threonine protein kinase
MTTAELGHENQTIQPDRHLVAGRYRLHERIGHGRLGDIYEGTDEGYKELGVGQHVAVQLLPEKIALDRGLFNKLKVGYTELKAAAHPNIVPFLDFDHDGKFGYLAMGFLDGASLRFVLEDATTLPLDEASAVIRAVGDALRFLHARSIVHGQLTADSIFITEDLEVRLLDVVPLDSDATILRNVASSDPFSRCDVQDDIYALACLAYEMLAGRHPFNYQTLAEARHAKLRPARINALPERQWNAIRQALSFDRDQRMTTVADFLHELGITGSERLRRSDDTAPNVSPGNSSHEAHSPTDAGPDVPLNPTLTPLTPKVEPDIARAKRLRSRRLPLSVLLIILAGLGTWFFYGQPRDDIVVVIDYAESLLDAAPGDIGGGAVPISPSDPVAAAPQAMEPEGQVLDDQESAIFSPDTSTQTVDGGIAETGTTAVDAITATDEAATEEAAAQPAEEQLTDPGADTVRSYDDGGYDDDSPAEAGTETTLIQSFVTLSERDGAARITTRRPQDADGRFVWWTSDDTAIADADYIPIVYPVVAFESGDEAETLHIPLVNDSLAEPRETFYVYLGQHDTQLGRLEPILRVRVEINDDD